MDDLPEHVKQAVGSAVDNHYGQTSAKEERCFICGKFFKQGDMVLPDINEGLGHRDCFGDDREGFVDLDTGEPIAPDEPLPTGEPYHTPPAPGGE